MKSNLHNKVYPGHWYDFFTGEVVGEKELIAITPGLDPVWVYMRSSN